MRRSSCNIAVKLRHLNSLSCWTKIRVNIKPCVWLYWEFVRLSYLHVICATNFVPLKTSIPLALHSPPSTVEPTDSFRNVLAYARPVPRSRMGSPPPIRSKRLRNLSLNLLYAHPRKQSRSPIYPLLIPERSNPQFHRIMSCFFCRPISH